MNTSNSPYHSSPHSPKILPWLAHKAGISEARAAQLWFEAICYATDKTGWVGTSEYWRVANERLVELIEMERKVGQVTSRFIVASPKKGKRSILPRCGARSLAPSPIVPHAAAR